jgi:hypothetical protein
MSAITAKNGLRAAAAIVIATSGLLISPPPADAAIKYASIFYSDATGAWGWAMLGNTQQEVRDLALNYCVGAGGTGCHEVAVTGQGAGCAALVRVDRGPGIGGIGPTNDAAQADAYRRAGGGGKLLVATCSGLDNETAPAKGAGGVSPLPAAPPPPPPPPPPVDDQPQQNTVAVNGDVDVYDVPGGAGNIIGTLDGPDDGAGDRVPLFQCKTDNWCEVGFAAGPKGRGWVWGDFLNR